jgi:hypothetical protein
MAGATDKPNKNQVYGMPMSSRYIRVGYGVLILGT